MNASFLITAGPTRERVDPVRFISNYSTGTFGYAIAKESSKRGFKTTLVSGPTHIKTPRGVRLIKVESALEMRDAVQREFKRHSCLIMAAAVSDWRVEEPKEFKIKRRKGPLTLRLVQNPDIVAGIAKNKGGRLVVGFALETRDFLNNAGQKLREKNLDLIVANKLSGGSNVFGIGLTDVVIIDRAGKKDTYRGRTKDALAKIILDKVLAFNI